MRQYRDTAIIYITNTFVGVNTTEDSRILIDGKERFNIGDRAMPYLSTKDKNEIITTYFYYNESTKMTHFPRYFLDKLVQIINSYGFKTLYRTAKRDYDYSDTILNNKEIKINEGFTLRQGQEDWINHLIDDGDGTGSMRLLDIQMGLGKTFCAINAIIQLGYRAMIICPAMLFKEWVEKLDEYTNIPTDRIFVSKGNSSIKQLDKMVRDNNITFDVLVIGRETLFSYLKNKDHVYEEGFPQMLALFDQLKIGVKVTDELHLAMNTNTLIDLNLNIPKNIYLTATPSNSNKDTRMVMSRIYPTFIRYNFDNHNDYLNHVEVSYELPISNLPIKYFVIDKIGYSQIRYEKWLSNREYLIRFLVEHLFIPTIKEYFIKPNEVSNKKAKCFIYISRTLFGEKVAKLLNDTELIDKYNLRIGTYFSSKDPESKLEDLDVIITTIKSFGTGKDLPKLRTIISFQSLASDVATNQLAGRSREDKSLGEQYVVFLYNRHDPSHTRHVEFRKKHLNKISKFTISKNYRELGG